MRIYICACLPLQTFQANEDATEVVLNKIHSPVLTRFVRIRPQTWHNGIALRLELYGCRITGEGPLVPSPPVLLSVPPTACPGVLSLATVMAVCLGMGTLRLAWMHWEGQDSRSWEEGEMPSAGVGLGSRA